jgi:hypothetical protein
MCLSLLKISTSAGSVYNFVFIQNLLGVNLKKKNLFRQPKGIQSHYGLGCVEYKYFFFLKKKIKKIMYVYKGSLSTVFKFFIKYVNTISYLGFNYNFLFYNIYFIKNLKIIVNFFFFIFDKNKNIFFISDKYTNKYFNIDILNFIFLKKKYYFFFKTFFNINVFNFKPQKNHISLYKSFFKKFRLIFFFLKDLKSSAFQKFKNFSKNKVGIVDANINPINFNSILPVILNYEYSVFFYKNIIHDIFILCKNKKIERCKAYFKLI